MQVMRVASMSGRAGFGWRSGLRMLMVAAAALAAVLASATAVFADSSGPTAMGYEWVDNESPGQTVDFQWLDIASVGRRLERVSDCDDCVEQDVAVGFPFPFYGRSYTTVTVSSNGALEFEDDEHIWGPNELPTVDFRGPVILPFWSDWDPRSRGDIYAHTVRDWQGAGVSALVVQWTNVENYDCDDGDTSTWQAVLLADGRLLFQYLDTGVGDLYCNHGADMTVGIQEDAIARFVSYSHLFAGVPDRAAVLWLPSVEPAAEPTPAPTGAASQPAASPSAAAGGGAPNSGIPVVGHGPPRGGSGAAHLLAGLLAAAGAGLVILAASRMRS